MAGSGVALYISSSRKAPYAEQLAVLRLRLNVGDGPRVGIIVAGGLGRQQKARDFI
jgi:hypothetical protein